MWWICNGRRVPLHSTGKPGERWPAFAIVPAIPLPAFIRPSLYKLPSSSTFYDLWNEQSIGGCTYHVMHPR